MRILHTSDWHIGRRLYAKQRYDEMEKFLSWLIDDVITKRGVEALVIAGDVFDTSMPSAQSQQLYYNFLLDMRERTQCRRIVIIAGNHDSPAFLDAPSQLLNVMNISVVGTAREPEDEVLVLNGTAGEPELIVCAVPFLRDSDVRAAWDTQDFADRQNALISGISDHYSRTLARAAALRDELGRQIPIIVTGHMFVTGGRTAEDDGVRELYVGTALRMDSDIFNDKNISYTALGHLHVPQKVGGRDDIRYSGSPIPMGFGEAGQRKIVCLADVSAGGVSVEEIEIPLFRRLELIRGDWKFIEKRISELGNPHKNRTQPDTKQFSLFDSPDDDRDAYLDWTQPDSRSLKDPGLTDHKIWLEVQYDGPIHGHSRISGDLEERLKPVLEEFSSSLELLKARYVSEDSPSVLFGADAATESLEQLTPSDVFDRLMALRDIPEEDREALRVMHDGILEEIIAETGEDERG